MASSNKKMSQTVRKLMRRIKEDDDEGAKVAFEELEELMFSKLVTYGLHLGLPWQECHDVSQETMLKIWSYRKRMHLDSPHAYIYRIAHNEIMNHLRKRKHEVQQVELEKIVAVAKDLIGEMDLEALTVRECLRRLSLESRVIIVLSFYCGLSHEEIASVFAGGNLSSEIREYVESVSELGRGGCEEILSNRNPKMAPLRAGLTRTPITEGNSAKIKSRALEDLKACLLQAGISRAAVAQEENDDERPRT